MITFPEVTDSDVMDFSDAAFWNNSLLNWYNPSMPRSCFLNFLVGATWAEAATAATHARLFHRDYSSKVKDVIPFLIYKTNRSAAQQQVIVAWLDWYFTVTNEGSIVTNDNDIVITNS